MSIPDIPVSVRALRMQAVREASRKKNQERRARVLAHPDLADRLCKLLDLADARHWSGYLPAGKPAGPTAAGLVAICREALERDGLR